MAIIVSKSEPGKKLHLFLNISFLLLLSFYLTINVYPLNPRILQSVGADGSSEGCDGLDRYKDSRGKCAYVMSETHCRSVGYIDYLQLFFCICGGYPFLGYTILILWLVLLFYLLGDTAAKYFCSSLESLSRVLRLSPTIAGVTLLSLGNGAPDVFSSIVSFIGIRTGDVGLNSILGGGFFVSSVVTGIISIWVGKGEISVDKFSFIRDICFFLLAISSLLAIILVGRINIWGAMAFTSIYFFYVSISISNFCGKKVGEMGPFDTGPLLPVNSSFRELGVPLLNSIPMDEQTISSSKEGRENDLQISRSTSFSKFRSSASYYFVKFCYFLEMPINLPRRLTIPDISEERWSKPFAVASVTLAPLLVATLWISRREGMGSRGTLAIYLSGGLVGSFLGIAASVSTSRSSPPSRFRFPWLAGGFLMSITWTYIIAEELVSLLVSLGSILGIKPSILGLTVLAWGNSLGDLVANVAMALNNGPDGVQVAISGCYAGPTFNTLFGLGLSLVLSSWAEYPSSYVIPKDQSLFLTLGFLIGGLLWALLVLPWKGMKLDKILGIGLLAIYLCFLSLRLAESLGWVQLQIF